MKRLREHRVVAAAAMAALCLTLAMGTMVIFAQNRAEERLEARLGSGEPEAGGQRLDSQTLFRDGALSEEIAEKVCEKYGLDIEKATMGDITGDMVDYEIALSWLEKNGEEPLYQPEEGEYVYSLEVMVDDLHCFSGARPIIEEVCRAAGITPETAKISDLTAEQIQEISAKAYEASDHKDL